MTPEEWESVGRIFEAVRALPPEERSSFLDDACGQDEALRREVQSLLDIDGDEGDFLGADAMEDVAKMLVGEETPSLVGQRLGHYELASLIGAGGMGEVYRARDVSLKRDVAVKVLPSSFSKDVERLRRFKKEAIAASALNHPNILTIHEIGQVDSCHFMVSEYVEGETLRQRLSRSRMSLDEVTDVATRIAEGLAAAHAVGIVHRDIKPENIMLRPDGYVKILDFGLAKLNEQSVTDMSQSSVLKTEPGMPIGTPRYMSPEQVRGLPLDARPDVWSLGVVLYEMLSGRVPFEGITISDVLASILAREPTPLASSTADVPPKLQRIVLKALEKDREERYQGVKEMLLDLKGTSKETGNDSLFEKIKRHKKAAMMLAVLVVAVAFGPAIIRWVRSRLTPPSPPVPPMKVSQLTNFVGFENDPAFSPDGNFLAFTWRGEKHDNLDIYIMRIGSGGPPFRLTNDPAEDMHPAWSPDGTQIAFNRWTSETDKASFIIPAPWGGLERKIYTSQVKSFWGGEKNLDWTPDGKFIVATDRLTPEGPAQLLLISPETLERRQLTFAPDQTKGDLHPQFSPDSKFVAFVRTGNDWDRGDIYVVELARGEPRQLTFESKRVEQLTWTTDGRKLIFSSNRDGMQRLWSIAASGGTPENFALNETGATTPTVSRNGNRLAFVKKVSDANMYSISLRGSPRGVRSPFASTTKGEGLPSFSPDGRRVAFTSDRSGDNEIWLCNSDGSSQIQLTTTATDSGSPRWSPDGELIAFDSRERIGATRDVYVMNPEGGPRRLVTPADRYDETLPSWSRDGQWIYFTSKRGGDWQVWKVSATGGAPIQVTKQGGNMTYESADGQFVYYAKGREVKGIWRIPVNGGDEVAVLDSVEGAWGNWAVMPDGIYYIEPNTKKGAAIEFFSFSSGRITEVVSLGKVEVSWGGLAISPDGKWAIYKLEDHGGSDPLTHDYLGFTGDIMLVENYVGQ